MSQPAGFTVTGEEGHLVYRLKKSLYGLKQASRMWYQKFDSYIRQLSYSQSDSNPCLYARQLSDESRIYLILYVNDMLIAGSNQSEIEKLKRSLHNKFAMKELRQARHILGMRIKRNQNSLLNFKRQIQCEWNAHKLSISYVFGLKRIKHVLSLFLKPIQIDGDIHKMLSSSIHFT